MTSNKSFIFGSEDLAARLKKGAAALLPTDTVPALASIPAHASQLWKIKQRPANKPLILMASTPSELFKLVDPYAFSDGMYMAEKYWPGALTLVMPAAGPIVDALNPGAISIGLRIPACNLIRELLLRTGALATTSANLSGEQPAQSADEAMRLFPSVPLLGPLPWSKSSGLASTVIAWQKDNEWKVLRQGSFIPDELKNQNKF